MRTDRQAVGPSHWRQSLPWLSWALALMVLTVINTRTRGAISVVDAAITPIASANNPTNFTISSFTVSPTANVLIVEVGTRGVSGSADTITFGGQTLLLAVQVPSVNTVFRDSAIYYLYNPTPGTGAISGTFSPTGISDYVISAFTLGGVNTSIAPITTGADGQTAAATTATLPAAQAANVVAGSFAVMEQTLNGGTGPFTYSATAGGSASGTATQLWQGTSGANILAAGGDVANLLAGTDSYTGAATTNTNSKNPLAVAIFTPSAGVNWIGGTSSDWATGSNWQGGSAPNASGAGAIFGNAAANPTVTLVSSGKTVGAITFNANVGTTIGGANTISLNNGAAAATIAVSGGTHAINAPLTLSSDLAITAAAASQLTIGGNISQASAGKALSLSGGGTLILGGTNSYSGPTTVSAGVLRVNNANSLQNSTATVNVNGGLVFGPSVGTFNLGGLAGSGNISLTDTGSAAVNLNVGGNNATTTYSGRLSGAGAIAKVGSGTFSLAAASTHSGGTTVSSGTLRAGLAGSLGTGPVTIANGATLRVAGNPAPLLTGFGGTSSDITGTGTGWTVNNVTITSNPINNNVLTLTDNLGNEARSAFFNTPKPISSSSGGFVASFTYTASGNQAADGVAFVLQNDARGPAAIGDAGGALAYSSATAPIQPSVGIALNIYNPNVIGTNLLVGGNGSTPYISTTPVNPGSGNPINVTVSYSPATATITETLVDAVANTSFTTQYTGQDLTSLLGSTTAYVGFTGATGGATATQTISNFTYGADSSYSNGLVLPAGSSGTIDVVPTLTTSTIVMGSLTVSTGAGSTLNVTASTAPVDTAYGLSLAGATLSGNFTVNVANNGAGFGTVTMGAVADTGTGFGLTKSGAGTLILTGPNTYRGATTVNAGTLRLADSSGTSNNNVPMSSRITVGSTGILNVTGLANGRLILANGQTLTGSGTVNGAVTAGAGSIIAGVSGSTLNLVGGLTLADQSHSSFTLAAPNGSGNPLVSVSGGAFSVGGNNVVDLAGAAQPGTYKLYGYTSGSSSANQFSIGANTAGFFNYAFNVLANSEVDLIVTQPYASAAWNYDDNGSYSEITKWSPKQLPIGAGLTATFGNGVTTTVGSAPVLTVLVDGAETVGSLVLNNSNGLSYILGNDQIAGHGIALNNNGAGAAVNVSSTTPQQIQANLVLADNTVFNVAPGGSLLVTVGAITESGGSRSISLSGGGLLTIDTPSTYTGGTTVVKGTLTTTPTGTLGPGPLAVNPAGNVSSIVNLGSNQTVTSLSGVISGGGTARVNVSGGTTLVVNQTTNTAFAGVLALAPGPAVASAGSFTKSAAGILEIQGAPSLGNKSSLNVSGGALKFNVAGGTAAVGTGVVVTVTNSAKLELAGAIAALASGGSPLNRANIVNNSTAAAGLIVSGNNQVVGGIDGSGTTQVTSGGDLTANHIVQSALLIGGASSSLGQVTIAESDANGDSLATSAAAPLAASALAATLGPPGQIEMSLGVMASSLPGGLGVFDRVAGGPNLRTTAVPEPATNLLAMFALATGAATFRRRVHSARRAH